MEETHSPRVRTIYQPSSSNTIEIDFIDFFSENSMNPVNVAKGDSFPFSSGINMAIQKDEPKDVNSIINTKDDQLQMPCNANKMDDKHKQKTPVLMEIKIASINSIRDFLVKLERLLTFDVDTMDHNVYSIWISEYESAFEVCKEKLNLLQQDHLKNKDVAILCEFLQLNEIFTTMMLLIGHNSQLKSLCDTNKAASANNFIKRFLNTLEKQIKSTVDENIPIKIMVDSNFMIDLKSCKERMDILEKKKTVNVLMLYLQGVLQLIERNVIVDCPKVGESTGTTTTDLSKNQLEQMKITVNELVVRVKTFSGQSKDDVNFITIDSLLMNCLGKLSTLNVLSNVNIRNERNTLLKRVWTAIEELDKKATINLEVKKNTEPKKKTTKAKVIKKTTIQKVDMKQQQNIPENLHNIQSQSISPRWMNHIIEMGKDGDSL